MLHLLAANYDWHHTITPTSEEIKVFATIFPMVSSTFSPPSSRILTDNLNRTTSSSASPGASLPRPRWQQHSKKKKDYL
jgi:hypothetical protein